MKKVESIEELIELLEETEAPRHFFINLSGGIRSSKEIMIIKNCVDRRFKEKWTNKFWIFHSVDGRTETITENSLRESFIAEAINKGAFHHDIQP